MYFGVDPGMLTPAQAAFLAALPQRPTAFNPLRNMTAAQTRQRTVLRRMAAAGSLSPDQLRDALAERLAIDRGRVAVSCAALRRDGSGGRGNATAAANRDDAGSGAAGGVEGILEQQRDSLRHHGARNVAVVVLDNARGEWIAWEGSGDYLDTNFGGAINGPLVPRQPGSR